MKSGLQLLNKIKIHDVKTLPMKGNNQNTVKVHNHSYTRNTKYFSFFIDVITLIKKKMKIYIISFDY